MLWWIKLKSMRLWSCWSQHLLSHGKSQKQTVGTESAEVGDEEFRSLALVTVILFPKPCLVRSPISCNKCAIYLKPVKLGFLSLATKNLRSYNTVFNVTDSGWVVLF